MLRLQRVLSLPLTWNLIVIHRLWLLVFAAGISALVGCSRQVNLATEMDASELLALFQERQHADARNYVEADLGRFRVTHGLSGGAGHLHVQFHLYGILPLERQQRLAQTWPHYEKRVRDAIIGLCQRTETEHLADPSLTFFKEEIVATVNRVLQERLLVDVAFSDFSTDREAGMPWSAPAAAPKPSGHGH